MFQLKDEYGDSIKLHNIVSLMPCNLFSAYDIVRTEVPTLWPEFLFKYIIDILFGCS